MGSSASILSREETVDSAGAQIFVRSWTPGGTPRAIVTICHGVNSHGGYFVWVGEQLAARGFAVYALDLRGRGRSSGERFYVEEFSEYLRDVDTTIALARSRTPGLPVFLLGHSAGGVVSSVYALEHQDELAGLICESFAFRVPAPDFVLAVVKGVSHVWPHTHVLTLKNEDFSRDPEVVARMNRDPLIRNESQPAQTVAQLVRADERLEREFPLITLPLFIMHGTADKATRPEGSQLFYDRAGSTDKTLKLYEGHVHDLLNDYGREEVMADIIDWIDTRLDGRPAAAAGQPAGGAVAAPTQWVESRGRRLAYRSVGSGTPLLLSTRFRGNLDTWDPAFLDALAGEGLRVITFDYSGLGLSTGERSYDLTALATDAVDLLDALGLGAVAVGGWSLGGLAAQVLLATRPERVSHLVLIGSGPPGPGPKAPEPIFFETAARPENSIEDQVILFFEPSSPASVAAARASADRMAARTSDRSVPVPWEWAAAHLARPRGPLFASDAVLDALRTTSVPILHVGGDHDVSFPVENWYALNRQLPTLQLVTFPRSGHGPQHQHPEASAAAIATFIRTTAPGTPALTTGVAAGRLA